jgi:hypothetical protein
VLRRALFAALGQFSTCERRTGLDGHASRQEPGAAFGVA